MYGTVSFSTILPNWINHSSFILHHHSLRAENSLRRHLRVQRHPKYIYMVSSI